MKVRTNVAMSGTINGEPWPPRGGVIDLPDVVALKMLQSGQATPVVEPAVDVETTDDTVPVETREAPEDGGADELEAMHAEAERLGVKVHGNAKPETIRRKIEEAQAAAEAS